MFHRYQHTILIQLTPANDSYTKSFLDSAANKLDYILGDHVGDLNRNTDFLWRVESCDHTRTQRNNIKIPAIKGVICSLVSSFDVFCENDTLKLMDSLVYLYDDLAIFKSLGFNVKFSLKSAETYCTYDAKKTTNLFS